MSMEKSSLTALVRAQLDLATRASSGRSAHTVYGGHEHVLRQTLIALNAGQRMDEHENPGEATVQVLRGRVRLIAGEISWEGSPGDLLIVPQGRHALEALETSAILLTVAKLA
jgi:quercetin dioxygenase-like cupin family protein